MEPTLSNIILTICGHKVILDADLAKLYCVPTKRLNEQLKRNQKRFPKTFAFKLTIEETDIILSSRSQIATLKRGQNIKYLPYVFTEHGALMAANVLNSPHAISMSVKIINTFIELRKMTLSVKDLEIKVKHLEKQFHSHDKNFKLVFDAIRELMNPPFKEPKKKIGFHPNS